MLCVLVCLAGTGCSGRRSAESLAVEDLRAISQALHAYEMLNGDFPTQTQGLRALIEEPRVAPRAKHWHPLMNRLPSDPWGAAYVYVYPTRHPGGRFPFDLFSLGADGVPSGDDIGNWAHPDLR